MASRIFARQLLLIFFIVLLSGFSGCSTEEDSSSESYYVRFNLNGTDYEFTSGISKDTYGNTYSGDACGFRTNDNHEDPGICIFASPSPADLNNFESIETFCFLVAYEDSGAYTGTEPTTIKINTIKVWECDPIFTVTEIGNFGEVIAGTFSGVDLDTGKSVTDGEFSVKRLSDNIMTY